MNQRLGMALCRNRMICAAGYGKSRRSIGGTYNLVELCEVSAEEFAEV